jgi:hypothetical protein
VVVHTTEEGCRRILSDHLSNEVPAPWVLVHELRNIVNETGDQNKGPFG